MATESYSKIAGKKTVVLISVLIGLVLILTVFIVFMLFRKSGVLTNSISTEKPATFAKPTHTFINSYPTAARSQNPEPKIPVRYGD